MDDRKSSNRLRFAVIKNLKIVLRQTADATTLSIAHHDRYKHFIHGRSQHWSRGFRLGRICGLRLLRPSPHAAEKRDQPANCNHKES